MRDSFLGWLALVAALSRPGRAHAAPAQQSRPAPLVFADDQRMATLRISRRTDRVVALHSSGIEQQRTMGGAEQLGTGGVDELGWPRLGDLRYVRRHHSSVDRQRPR